MKSFSQSYYVANNLFEKKFSAMRIKLPECKLLLEKGLK